ncbi:MAG: tetratricopeptide repeat protein [Phycisphaerales bacterium]|nr:MAG: tetratricopeptide repeat protein [Phycisphaerales bacterium]
MTERDDLAESGLMDDSLDAALLAAFGPESEAPAGGAGVLQVLERTVGVRSRVLLRDDGQFETPLVRPQSAQEPAAAGSVGRYQIVGELARGGVGVVLKSRDTDLGRDVAMKVLRPDHVHNRAMVARFVEEAQIAGQLQHPGILPVYEMGVYDEKTPFFTMKLVKGKTLAGLLAARRDPADERPRFISIFEHVCQTIAYAHARGVIHRDLKPSNVMVGAFGEVQVVDWGLAKVLTQGGLADERGDDESVVTTVRTSGGAAPSMVGSVMGTPAYMPPEQARGDIDRLDERADVFSLGAILCEILTGKPPFTGSHEDILQAATECRLGDCLRRLKSCGGDDDLVDLARRSLSPVPQSRPATAREVADTVTRHLQTLEARARAADIEAAEARAAARQERRARRLTLGLGAAIVAALLAVGGGYRWVEHERRERLDDTAQMIHQAVDRAAMLLGRAKSARVGETAQWAELESSLAQFEEWLEAGEANERTHGRLAAFVPQLRRDIRDRRMIDRIEDTVMIGATHEDRESWLAMDRAFAEGFRDYGIDVLTLPHDEIARRMKESAITPNLADGLELWIGTRFHLMSFGEQLSTVPELLGWVEILYQADPDPVRTRIRKVFYSMQPDLTELYEIEAALNYEAAFPRTISWLASAIGSRAGDMKTAHDVFRRAVIVHPDDFMLNFDYAYHLVPTGNWQEAIRYYLRCLAIRPDIGGIWRSLGLAYRQTGELQDSKDALVQSIAVQPEHAPTHVDLGRTLEDLSDLEGAIGAYREAVRLKPDYALAWGRLGLALQAQGRLPEALEALETCDRLGAHDPSWTEPSAEWVETCRRKIEEAR